MYIEKRMNRKGRISRYYRVTYKTVDGARHIRSFSDRARAVDFERLVKKVKALPTASAQREMLSNASGPLRLDACIEEFMTANTNGTRGRSVLAYNTLRGYRIKLALAHKYIRENDVRKLQRKHIVALKDKLVEIHYARRTINSTLTTLHNLLNWLVDEGRIEQNPSVHVTVKKDRNYPQDHVELDDIYSDRNVEAILATYDERSFVGLRNKVSVELGFFCGLRISEVLGLEWRHIDFDRKHITVAQSAHDRDGSIQRPKTANSRRVVPMNAIVRRELIKWRDRCIPDVSRVFTTAKGRPICQRNQLKSLQIAQQKAKLPIIRSFHETRHYFASKLIETGFTPLHIARIIGHADITLTLRVYGHLINQGEDRTSEYNRITEAFEARPALPG